ncbi:hypothetical protein [Aeromonas dhakensis]|uniref:hypothetical protein n=1 Tax=Aeromonas dhakensis TaxID=196024 RepID=UPI00117824A5|nr:hypothetical protein [Aeromonas dhakensis]
MGIHQNFMVFFFNKINILNVFSLYFFEGAYMRLFWFFKILSAKADSFAGDGVSLAWFELLSAPFSLPPAFLVVLRGFFPVVTPPSGGSTLANLQKSCG